MNYLVGDIGNTFIKLSILNNNFKIKKIYNLETKKIFKETFKRNYLNNKIGKNLHKKALFSSVVPKAFKIIKNHLSKKKDQSFRNKTIKNKKDYQY